MSAMSHNGVAVVVEIRTDRELRAALDRMCRAAPHPERDMGRFTDWVQRRKLLETELLRDLLEKPREQVDLLCSLALAEIRELLDLEDARSGDPPRLRPPPTIPIVRTGPPLLAA